MSFADRFQLSRAESVFLAKKKWDENVYCGMRMENRAVTFPQTKTILSGVNVPSVRLDDIQAILNMRDAWRFLLQDLDAVLNREYLCQLNGFIARNESLEWGVLRTGNVGISGTDYEPPIPDALSVDQSLITILSSSRTNTEKALDLFLWCARSQLFWDGNKRTGMTAANKVLLSAGAGMLTITDSHMETFNTLLLRYYNTNETADLKEFLYQNCLYGLSK